MDALINTTPGGGGKPVMSSREIAELTDKEHKNVKRDIEKMLIELGEDTLKFERIYRDSMNREQTEYLLDRDLTENLLLGYSPILRRKVLKRMREMEEALSEPRIPTTAEAFAQAFTMLADAERRQAAQDAKLVVIDAKVDMMAQSLTIHDKAPPNGELVTHLRKRVAKTFGLSFDVINKVLDKSEIHPKFSVRNHHANADGSVNFGYWIREVNDVFRRFVNECEQVSPTQCVHRFIDGRFRLIKPAKA